MYKNLFLFFSMLCTLSCGVKHNADMLITNGKIYTMDANNSVVEALAIRDGKIIDAGTTADITGRYAASRLENLNGQAAYPGFTDAHLHLMGIGRALQRIDLIGTKNFETILEKVKAKAATVPAGQWIQGRGWDQNDWEKKEFPTNEALNALTPDHYVVLGRVDGHAILVNQKVLNLVGITRATQDPPGGQILRNAAGDPTGVLIDNAMDIVYNIIPPPSLAEDREALDLAMESCLAAGLTSVHDAGVDTTGLRLYHDYGANQRLRLRIYAMLDGMQVGLSPTGGFMSLRDIFIKGPQKNLYNNFLSIASVKLYSDGALGSRGAALLQPYSDDPKNSGLEVTAKDRIQQITEEAIQYGYQVNTHAIGDRGNRNVIDAYETAFKKFNADGKTKRFRIEHAQVISLDDIPRLAPLGIIASMQPTHCTSDMYWAQDRLGAQRVLGAYAWKRLMDSGALICNGSDAPVESNNPLWGIYAAVTRQDHEGKPDGGWYPDQRMTVFEAIKGFTINAAYAAFEEDIKGSLEKGKLADIVVLSNDITTIPPKEILNTKVERTFVNGKVVYKGFQQQKY